MTEPKEIDIRTHKVTMASEPRINAWEKATTEQFAKASLEVRKIAAQVDKLGAIMCEAGVEPDVRSALGLLACAVAVLRRNHVAPRLILEAMGAFIAGAAGGIIEGNMIPAMEMLSDVREARVKELLIDKKHTLLLEMDEDVVGTPLTVIMEHTRNPDGTFKLSCSLNFHPDAVDTDLADKVPKYTLRSVAEGAIEALKEAVADTPDPKVSN